MEGFRDAPKMTKDQFSTLKAGDIISSVENCNVFTVASVNLLTGVITTLEDGHLLPFKYWEIK